MKTQTTPAWLNSAVFYEIYPQSFYDSNADGIGDLQGIIQKLNYVASLGCNAIWLNPCFESPFGDAGYDISDFYKVAPRYGTDADLRELFAKAKERGIRVVLDLVAGHTSIEHPWFKASCDPQPNKYSNWYIWTENVWQSAPPPLRHIGAFCQRDGNYITNFFHFQPALNYGFANPDPARPWQLPIDHPDVQAVHAELRNIIAFWLDQGAAGFRVDMASSLIKTDEASKAMIVFWQEVRTWMEKDYPDAVLISEWSMPERAIQAGFHIDFMIHFGSQAYTSLFRRHVTNDQPHPHGPSFFHRDGKGDIQEFLQDYLHHYEATKGAGFVSLPTGNHDITRLRGTAGMSERSIEELKVAYAFLFTMPGVPFVYYGDEIGMRNVGGLPSKEGGYCRTAARTPMQWNSQPDAGFSLAAPEEWYLPLDPQADRPNVEVQEMDGDSLLNFTRAMIRFRAAHPALQAGAEFFPLHVENGGYPFVYRRQTEGETLIVAINPSAQTVTATISTEKLGSLGEQISGAKAEVKTQGSAVELRLPGISYAVFRSA